MSRHVAVGEAFRPPATSLPAWMPARKRNRLPAELYHEPGTFFVTTTTANRRRWLSSGSVVAHCRQALIETCSSHNFALVAYCFMPDHVHFLASTNEENDLGRLVKDFKQRTGYWFRNRSAAGGLKASPTLWQRSYYDHVLRREEDVTQVVKYILDNPVVAGLVENHDEFPHSWSAFAPV